MAGLFTLSTLIVSIVIVVGGMGLRMIGVPPTAEEVLRLFAFIFLSIIYGAFWMSLAVLFSILFRRTATSALASIALWIFLFFFLSMIAGYVANASVPISQNSSAEMLAQNDTIYRMISRISPGTLYGESVRVLLMPEMGNASSTLVLISIYTAGLIPGSLSLEQSLIIVWPQIIGLVALTVICFAISYIKFMREEIRAT